MKRFQYVWPLLFVPLIAWGANVFKEAIVAKSTVSITNGPLSVGAASANAKTVVDMVSSSLGVRFPSLTTTARDSLGNLAGLMVFNSTTGYFNWNDGSAWLPVSPYWTGVAYVKDIKSDGTSPQSITAGSYVQRNLNDLSGNTDFISLGTNEFTLDPGTYEIEIHCPLGTTGTASINSKCKLRNTTASTDVFLSQNINLNVNPTATGASASAIIHGSGSTTIGVASTFQVQQRVSSNAPGGIAVTFGDDEVYTEVVIRKLDYNVP